MALHPSTFRFNRQMDPVGRTKAINIVQSRAYSLCGIRAIHLQASPSKKHWRAKKHPPQNAQESYLIAKNRPPKMAQKKYKREKLTEETKPVL